MLERLTAADIPGTIRYKLGLLKFDTAAYSVFVADENARRAAELLQLDDGDDAVDEDELDDELEADSPRESIVACPRCGLKNVSFPDDGLLLVGCLSVPLLCLPMLGYFTYTRIRGSKKRCESCHHVWRSKP